MTAEQVAAWCQAMGPEDPCEHPGCGDLASQLVTGTWRVGGIGLDVELGRYCSRHAVQSQEDHRKGADQ